MFSLLSGIQCNNNVTLTMQGVVGKINEVDASVLLNNAGVVGSASSTVVVGTPTVVACSAEVAVVSLLIVVSFVVGCGVEVVLRSEVVEVGAVVAGKVGGSAVEAMEGFVVFVVMVTGVEVEGKVVVLEIV